MRRVVLRRVVLRRWVRGRWVLRRWVLRRWVRGLVGRFGRDRDIDCGRSDLGSRRVVARAGSGMAHLLSLAARWVHRR